MMTVAILATLFDYPLRTERVLARRELVPLVPEEDYRLTIAVRRFTPGPILDFRGFHETSIDIKTDNPCECLVARSFVSKCAIID